MNADDAQFQTFILIGQVTPPVGIALYAGVATTGESATKILREAIPFLLMFVVGLAIIIVFPQISLFLRGLMGR